AYVKKERMSTIEAIGFLKEEGAVPVIAHPLSVGFPDLREFLIEMKKMGLLGVESEYNYRPMKVAVSSEDVGKASLGLNLIQTGGSDYHGNQLMAKLGSVTVPTEIIEKIRKAADR
ncbi:MAG: hypothetical protein EAX81_08235, partial [Candidatus Thorarchaeota archaeon]|nr:hypothetical protein [Candidatus Thorarchaeota archaeon]